MCRNQALQLQQHHGDAAGEEKVDEDHADGRELGGDGDEVEVGLYAPLVLRYGIAHGENEGLAEHHVGHARYVVNALRLLVSLGFYSRVDESYIMNEERRE